MTAAATLALDCQLTLDGFELELSETLKLDSVLGVLGPSGSGKTSLLRCIAGLERRVTGSIGFQRDEWHNSASGLIVPPHRRSVGYVFQDARLIPNLSVAANLRFAIRRARGGPEISERTVIRTLELEGLLERYPDTLSGGERQRVAIGRALVSRPQLLLMDEPLSATDIDRRGDLLPFLRSVIEQFRLPTLYVSHSLDELAAVSDDLLVLRKGRRAALGKTASVMGRLDLGEVSSITEAGSVIQATLLGHDDELHLSRLDFAGQPLSVPRFEGQLGDRVMLRIHARDVALATEAPVGLSIRNILQGVIREISEDADGPSADVLVTVREHSVRARITRASLYDLALGVGTSVHLLIKTASVETG